MTIVGIQSEWSCEERDVGKVLSAFFAIGIALLDADYSVFFVGNSTSVGLLAGLSGLHPCVDGGRGAGVGG